MFSTPHKLQRKTLNGKAIPAGSEYYLKLFACTSVIQSKLSMFNFFSVSSQSKYSRITWKPLNTINRKHCYNSYASYSWIPWKKSNNNNILICPELKDWIELTNFLNWRGFNHGAETVTLIPPDWQVRIAVPFILCRNKRCFKWYFSQQWKTFQTYLRNNNG